MPDSDVGQEVLHGYDDFQSGANRSQWYNPNRSENRAELDSVLHTLPDVLWLTLLFNEATNRLSTADRKHVERRAEEIETIARVEYPYLCKPP
jgi:hypothetical protein